MPRSIPWLCLVSVHFGATIAQIPSTQLRCEELSQRGQTHDESLSKRAFLFPSDARFRVGFQIRSGGW
jgi:hypothetical protein